jgi:hypothetical protein
MFMTTRSLCTAGISLAILAIATEGAALLRHAPSPWIALGAVAGLLLVLRRE